MPTDCISGTEGYAEDAGRLVEQYESVAFAHVHRHLLDLLPATAGLVLDIGSGTGRDAAAFAAMGHRVVAVEPTREFRVRAAALHPSPRIEWLDDSLPNLMRLIGREHSFDIVMLTAVWMHLDEPQRRQAMPKVASLMSAGGLMGLSLRHGPVPPGRRMFEVSGKETVHLAEAAGLQMRLKLDRQPAVLAGPGVSWTRLAFSKPISRRF